MIRPGYFEILITLFRRNLANRRHWITNRQGEAMMTMIMSTLVPVPLHSTRDDSSQNVATICLLSLRTRTDRSSTGTTSRSTGPASRRRPRRAGGHGHGSQPTTRTLFPRRRRRSPASKAPRRRRTHTS